MVVLILDGPGGEGSLGFRVVLKAGVSPASHIWEWE